MKILHRVVAVVLVVLALGVSGLTLAAAVNAERWNRWRLFLIDMPRLEAIGLALTLLFLVLVYGVSAWPRRPWRRVLSFDNENGTVSISTDAICDYIAKLAPEFPSVVKLTPTVIVGRQRIDLRIGLRLRGGPQVHEVCELLQQRVRERVSTGLGISQIGNVEVSVMDIVSEHKPQ